VSLGRQATLELQRQRRTRPASAGAPGLGQPLSIPGLPSYASAPLANLPAGPVASIQQQMGMPATQIGQAWSPIQAQIQKELGGGTASAQTALAFAQNQFTNALSTALSNVPNIDPGSALRSAQQTVLAGATIAGNFNHIRDLISSVHDPTSAINAFRTAGGLIVAASGAAFGAATAGVGALIVGAVAMGLQFLNSIGMFGSTPKGTELYPGFWVTSPNGPPWPSACANGQYTDSSGQTKAGCPPAPTIQVGNIVASWAAPVSPGSPLWRRFPRPVSPWGFSTYGGGTDADTPWFGPTPAEAGQNRFQWNGDFWYAPIRQTSSRPIDLAFPNYHNVVEVVMQGTTPGTPISDFHHAFIAAWLANQEFALNGLKPLPDYQVLQHVLRAWNRAHSPASTFPIGQWTFPPTTPPRLVIPQATQPSGGLFFEPAIALTGPTTRIKTTDATGPTLGGFAAGGWYEATLVTACLADMPDDLNEPESPAYARSPSNPDWLAINTGGPRVNADVAQAERAAAGGGGWFGVPAPVAGAAAATGGAVAAGGAAALLYSWATGKAMDVVFDEIVALVVPK
jgi:hypothetical protein